MKNASLINLFILTDYVTLFVPVLRSTGSERASTTTSERDRRTVLLFTSCVVSRARHDSEGIAENLPLETGDTQSSVLFVRRAGKVVDRPRARASWTSARRLLVVYSEVL